MRCTGIMVSLILRRSWTRHQEWGSLFDCQYRSIMRTDRLQKAGFEQLGDYWFKSLLGFCGQGILSLGYYLRGIFKKNLYRGWCQATSGVSVSQNWRSIGGRSGGRFWEWGLAKGSGAIWMQRIDMGSKNGRFIEVCSLARRSHPNNVIGHWETTIKECVSVALPKEQRRGGVIWG